MYSKCALLVALVAVIALTGYSPTYAYSHYGFQNFAANSANRSHHLIAGARLPGDRLTFQGPVVKSPSWATILTVERTFSANRGDRITQLFARDQATNGTGAYATIIRGGPGSNNVTLRFKSQKGYGINFVVQLYSRP